MTPKERVLAVLHGQRVDKVPFTSLDNFIPQCAVERRLRNEGMCVVVRRLAGYKEEKPNCVTETHTYTVNGHQRARTVVRTPVGEVSEIYEPAGFTSWAVEKYFKRPEDYKVLRFIAQDTHYLPDYEECAKLEKWRGEDVILRGFVGTIPLHLIMIHYMGVETFAVEWAERRDEVLKLEKAMSDKLREVFPIIAESPVTLANLGGNETPEVLGPPRYREFCLPLINECGEIFHRKGKLLGTHLDGNNRAWAADIAASKLDYIEAFTPAPGTDMTLSEALKAWPDKVLWINFPSVVHLASIEKVKQTARELIEAAAGTNRLIIGITEDVPEDRWQGSLLAISEVIQEYAAK